MQTQDGLAHLSLHAHILFFFSAQALHDILAKSADPKRGKIPSVSEDVEDVDAHTLVKDSERLVSCLPNITHFAVILPQIYPFLLQACLVETNLNCLQHYLLFLAQNYPHDKLYESVLGISRLVVDRFDIIKKILSPPSCTQSEGGGSRGSYSLMLLGSLFELFRSAMEAAIHSQTMPQLSSADFVLVTFPSVSQKAILHTAFVQAVYLLLSQNPSPGVASNDFTYLLDLWIPIQPLNRPEACAIEGKEKFPLPPDEILQSTLLSTSTRVLEASMQVAKPALLCKFVQQFGCPVVSVDKALEVLDSLCNESSSTSELRRAVLEPPAMSRSVQIQMSRGTRNGSNFLSFIRGLANNTDSDLGQTIHASAECRIGSDSSIHRSSSKPLVRKSEDHLQVLSLQDLKQQLVQIFLLPSDVETQVLRERRKFMLVLEDTLKGLLSSKQCSPGAGETHLNTLLTALSQLLSGKSISSIKFLEGMANSRFSLSLLRMLTRLQEQGQLGKQLSEVFKNTLHHICVLLELSGLKGGSLKLFVAVVKSCCHSLGVGLPAEKDETKHYTSRACKDIAIKGGGDIEATVLHLIERSSFGYLERVVSSLVKQSVDKNLEPECISRLHRIRTAIASYCVPIALQYNPQLFLGTSSFSTEKPADCVLPCSPDAEGLLVDTHEILDPEIVSCSPEVSMKLLFGCSEKFKAQFSSLCSSWGSDQLLHGQGYLFARLVNNSSWQSLFKVIHQVLDRSSVQDW